MDPVEPDLSTLLRNPARPARPWYHRPVVAAGLIGMGSVLGDPSTATAAGATSAASAAVTAATDSASASAESEPAVDADLSDEAHVELYVAAGYTEDDAVVLARYWEFAEPYKVKVEVGQLLARGVTLKLSPFVDSTAADGYGDEHLIELFFGSGYTPDDATVLAQNWSVDVIAAKVRAGSELKAVGVLPFVDPAPPVAADTDQETARFTAFFDAGLDYDDAVVLAGHWGTGTPAEAKLAAGALLLADQPLPELPGLAAS